MLIPSARRRPILVVLLCLGLMSFSGCGGSSSSPKSTLLALSSSNTKAASGGSVTFTATLSALANNPTGTVTFYDGTTALGQPAPLTSGSATLQTSALSVGAHTISAAYSGDKNNSTSNSSALVQVVTGTSTLQISATSGSLVHTVSLPITLN